MRRKKRTLKKMKVTAEMINPDATQIQAAGGLLFYVSNDSDSTEILLIFRNGVWDLPKGKLEKGESIAECAVREVSEEVGLSTRPDILADLGTTRHTYSLKGELVEKETFWFLMFLPEHIREFTPEQSEGITEVRWVPTGVAMKKVGYENLKVVIRRFMDNLDNLNKIDLDQNQ